MKIWSETVFMEKAVRWDFSKKAWGAWLDAVGAPTSAASLDLVGLPGRMRLPADWRSGGRLAGEHLLYLVVEGVYEWRMGDETGVAEAGDLLWVGPGVEFQCRRDGRAPLVLLRMRLRLTQAGRSVAAPGPWRVFRGAQAAAIWFETLIGEAGVEAGVEMKKESGHRLRGLLLVLFTELAGLERETAEVAGRLTRGQRGALAAYVAANPVKRPTPAELAKVAGLSADYFTRCFRRTLGKSPRRWLLEQRVRHAAQHLLETERRVGEVAGDFGYTDVFLFSRQFKAVMGVSPARHRRTGA